MNRVEAKFEFAYAGARVLIYHANKGEGLPMHQHRFSHATMCHAGSCAVRKGEKEVVINRDTQPINLVADAPHEIEALEDGTVFVNIFENGKG